MADKKEDKKKKKENKIVLERVYNIPLRKKYMRAPRWKRTNRAVTAAREFIFRHMKATEVKIGKYANLELWKHGGKNPPHHIKVICKKDEEGLVKAELEGAPEEKPKEEPKKKARKEKAEKEDEIKVRDALGGEDAERKHIKEEKAKEIEKEEINELKKQPKTHAPKQPPMQKRVEQHPSAPMQK
ncbi:60S ribosomal protein L31 [Candidatus Woesearchaeota archaeon]|nr:60S ribosomal protein L31 [Candidatus Woesearchaeota archaeon]